MTSPALVINNLHFRYPTAARGTAAWLVDVASLELAPGGQLLLTGGSGCGKSTLLHLIAGLLDPTDGTVLVGGNPMHALHGAKRDLLRGRSLGMIFQTFNLLHGFSAVENVMAALMFADVKRFPLKEHRSRALDLLHSLGIDSPDAEPARMSVGQQQRVAVARAIACEPALVLADEPTASLDPENAVAAMDLIQQTCTTHNAALLCVSHDPSLAARFSHRRSMKELSQQPLSA